MGPYLTIGAEAKVGSNWGQMEKVELPAQSTIAIEDIYYEEDEEEDEESFDEWMRKEFV